MSASSSSRWAEGKTSPLATIRAIATESTTSDLPWEARRPRCWCVSVVGTWPRRGVYFFFDEHEPRGLRQLFSPEAYADTRARVHELMAELNRADDGRLVIEWTYALVVATREGAGRVRTP
jgi:hypothetical protein